LGGGKIHSGVLDARFLDKPDKFVLTVKRPRLLPSQKIRNSLADLWLLGCSRHW